MFALCSPCGTSISAVSGRRKPTAPSTGLGTGAALQRNTRAPCGTVEATFPLATESGESFMLTSSYAVIYAPGRAEFLLCRVYGSTVLNRNPAHVIASACPVH